ncbi:MAG TPA: Rid family hydrolase, partial [Polyangiaceae bacterium]
MPRQVIQSPSAPKAVGPYSHAVRSGSLVFTSGQIPLDPATGKLVDGAIGEQ